MCDVQICEKHYQKIKEDVDNKHPLQALPGLKTQNLDCHFLKGSFKT